MSICNVDKWNMLAPTFDAFEIPKIEEDDCLTSVSYTHLDVYKRQHVDMLRLIMK